MANPQKVANLHGTLILASSGSTNSGEAGAVELNMPIGYSLANSATLTSANVPLKAIAQSVMALVQLASGTALVTLDVTADGTTPTFASAKKSQFQVTRGEPIFLGPIQMAKSTVTNSNGVITVTPVTNIAALQITNQSGATLTITQLRMMTLTQLGPQNWSSDSRTADLYSGSGEVNDKSGTIVLNT